jgi:hypothetical protein
MSSGNIKEKKPDKELSKSLKKVAEKGLAFIKDKEKSIPKGSEEWTFVFREYYESLRGLIEAYLLFDSIAADSHQCKNAYLCHEHEHLKLDWEFLETIRLKRNAINYQGRFLKYHDWQAFILPFELHITILKKSIEEKLKE